MPPIAPGRRAPDFALRDQSGKLRRLSDFAGRALVIFFYPKDLTSACTEEACDFQSALGRIRRRGASVVGVSILGERSKRRFADEHGLRFPLLADDATDANGKPSPEVSRVYGVWGEKSMYGRKYMGILRTTFLIGPDGRVVRRWDGVSVPGHADEVLAAVTELGQRTGSTS